ncbi:MAG TPA: sialidase family protein [Mycobacteriales bacterium]|jgi:hypothetical protein|nr:sialidase family protein [Mycobacteriales bacterium]
MPHHRRRALAGAVPLLAALCALPSFAMPSAASTALKFDKNVTVYQGDYGEPGLSVDGANVYVTTPGDGGAVWALSRNGGRSFTKKPTVRPPADQQRGAAPGSDSDVAVGEDGAVYVGDLTIDGIEVSRSTDGGETFPQRVFLDTDLSADREWLWVDGKGDEAIVYVAWHELATGTMLVKRSTDAGKTFDAVPHVVYTNPQTGVESAHNGSSIGQITSDGKGHVYVVYGITRADTLTGATPPVIPISKIVMSVSDDYGVTWQDITVNPGYADANYGNFWMAAAVDKGGTVYVTYSGRNHDATEPMRVFLQASKDFGRTWTEEYVVSPEGGNSLFGWVAGGRAGDAVVSWYHTDSDNKDAADAQWVVQVAHVTGLADGTPVRRLGTASDHVMHEGGICTFGILCGVVPGTSDDRSLLDFFKVATTADGLAAVVFSDNGEDRHDVTFAKEVPTAVTPPTGTGGTGGGSGSGTGGSGGSGSGGSGMPATGTDAGLLALAAGACLVAAAAVRRRATR